MNRKQITNNCYNKLNEWLLTIDDESLRNDVEANYILTGGAITSMFLNKKVNDYDIYIKDINVLERLTNYYILKSGQGIKILSFKDKISHPDVNTSDLSGLEIACSNLKEGEIKLWFDGHYGFKVPEDTSLERPKYEPSFFSPHAITLYNGIQIVLRFSGDAEKIHESYDFIHATNYFTNIEVLYTL